MKRKIKINGIPKLSSIPKKDFDSFIALLELEIREYYSKQQTSTKKVPP